MPMVNFDKNAFSRLTGIKEDKVDNLTADEITTALNKVVAQQEAIRTAVEERGKKDVKIGLLDGDELYKVIPPISSES